MEAAMAELDDDQLLDALGVEVAPIKAGRYTPLEERLIAGFEDILRFHATNGRAPLHGEDRDIFERLYAMRLDRLRALPEARILLAPLDTVGLLGSGTPVAATADNLDDEALLAELGVDASADKNDIRVLEHVGTYVERRAADEVATRTQCRDFERFKPLFEKVERELMSGIRKFVRLRTRSLDAIQKGTFFIAGGQVAYVADVTDAFTTQYDRRDSRLRVIYDNGTESDVRQRSFQRALHRDEVARLISDPGSGQLFGDTLEDADIVSGTIYVLRSHSDHPFVAKHRELIHKIGVTSGKVETRVANAQKDATYLLADVEIVATYAAANLSCTRLENLFHRLFATAQLDLAIDDRFGHPVRPREWFLVPLQVIDEAVSRIRDGSITGYEYSVDEARLIPTVGR
jgi:T5orf172 domain